MSVSVIAARTVVVFLFPFTLAGLLPATTGCQCGAETYCSPGDTKVEECPAGADDAFLWTLEDCPA